MIETSLAVLISLFVLGGCFLIFAGLLGVIRFPDVYCRMHASTKGPTLGLMMVMIATIIFFATAGGHDSYFYSRSVLVVIFILITNPVGAHMLSKNAYRSGVEMWSESVQDDWEGKE